MAHEEKMLCRELNRKTGKVAFTERFMPCAEERCMAWGGSYKKNCLRLEDKHGNR